MQDWEEDSKFVQDLFAYTLRNDKDYQELIAERTKNWESERIALMDTILMKMAICELLNFPSIPVKVTINEYLELSKDYSTPKSNSFINGILDKIMGDLKRTNSIKKIGRGLNRRIIMKKILLLALAALTFASCQQNSKKEADSSVTMAGAADSSSAVIAGDAAVIRFETPNYSFGTVNQGEKVSYSYKFKNDGKSPLIITNAEASCGCTVPEVPKEPIKPGEEGEIKVVFNSEGKVGLQDKVVTVTSNGEPNVIALHLTGEVQRTLKIL